MCATRRSFMGIAASGLGLMASPLLRPKPLLAAEPESLRPPDASGERVAVSAGSFYRPYRSQHAESADVSTWAQIDLGSSQPIEVVKLYPANWHALAGDGFPLRFRIECSDDPDFKTQRLIADRSKHDYPDPGDYVLEFRAKQADGRYVRLTVTRLRKKKLPEPVSQALAEAPQSLRQEVTPTLGFHSLALSKIEVLSAGLDLAARRPVEVDTGYGSAEDAGQLTRPPRPQGEGIITDHPRNVTSPDDWRPVAYRAQEFYSGVELQPGLFLTALKNNIAYLLETDSVEDLLRQFRKRAGQSFSPGARKLDRYSAFWEETLAGSGAGRFLMGASNTLRWLDDAELRQRMNAVVDGIAGCRQRNGYIMAYPEDTFFVSERGAYTRSWLTHGLIDAGYAGSPQAFELLRGYYDWYNSRPFLREALRGCNQGGQGIVANTRLYFTPAGKPADIQVVQHFFQESYWLDDLAARRTDAVWQYPYDRPHVYLLTNLEAYLDLYRATGDRRYLDAVLGGWELYRENWQNVGGSFSIIEGKANLPKSNSLFEKLGETCGSAFWMLLNHRLHQLMPEEEKFIAEIEKSIYNVLLANHCGTQGIRYHTVLLGRKAKPNRVNTCCEGQGARLVASLPQFIYSTAEDGLYVNLFEPSSIVWRQGEDSMQLEMRTRFPMSPDVQLDIRAPKPMLAKIRIRVPSWAASAMSIHVNGERVTAGTPGRYVAIERRWSDGDVISFVAPLALKLTKYIGADQIQGRERFALECGPILMAAVGAGADTGLVLLGMKSPYDLPSRLRPVQDQPLHFTMPLDPGSDTDFMPYFEIGTQSFSCFPVIEARPLEF